MRRAAAGGVVAWALAVGCGPLSSPEPDPALTCRLGLDPSPLTLVSPDGAPRRGEVVARNLAAGTCAVTAELSGDPAWALEGEPTLTLVAGATRAIGLLARPERGVVHEARLRLEAAEGAQAEATLLAWTTVGPPPRPPLSGPRLFVTPREIDFGRAAPQCPTRARVIEAYSVGTEALGVPTATLTDDGGGAFALEQRFEPEPIPPGHSAAISATFWAPEVGTYQGEISITAPPLEPKRVPLSGVAERYLSADRFEQLAPPQLDLLLVIDGPSMAPRAARLTRWLEAMLANLYAEQVDFRIGVVDARAPDATLGELLHAASDAPFVERGPDPFGRLEAHVARALTSTHSGPSRGLEAGFASISNGTNAGFHRAGAVKALGFATGVPDSSPRPVHYYVSSFSWLNPGTRVWTPVVTIGGPEAGCTDAAGAVPPTPRYEGVASALGRALLPVCRDDLGPHLSAHLSGNEAGVFRKASFYLVNQPTAGTIEVEVDGAALPSEVQGEVAWTYDYARNAIHFAPDHIPLVGERVIVRYEAECL